MEHWPSISKDDAQLKQKKDKGRENCANYPVINHGGLVAATLVKSNGKLAWRTVHSSRRG